MSTHFQSIRVAFLDLGQGDTSIISVPDTKETIIVDCVDAEAVVTYLERYNLRYIRGIIITHVHADHYRGVVELLNNSPYQCEQLLFYWHNLPKDILQTLRHDADKHSMSGEDDRLAQKRQKDTLYELLTWAQKNRERSKPLAKDPDRQLPLPEIIELIHPWYFDIPDLLKGGLNNISGILKVSLNGHSILLMGDLEPTGWQWLKNHYNGDLRSDVLKFPHHGAWRNASPDEILDSVEPSIVVISVGTSGSQYQHPNIRVLESIAQREGVQLFCTQVNENCLFEISQVRNEIIEKFRKESEKEGMFFVEQNGCPCAGTVIIEIGDSIKVLQPSPVFHQLSIINSYYPDHKCFIDESPSLKNPIPSDTHDVYIMGLN